MGFNSEGEKPVMGEEKEGFMDSDIQGILDALRKAYDENYKSPVSVHELNYHFKDWHTEMWYLRRLFLLYKHGMIYVYIKYRNKMIRLLFSPKDLKESV
jgi:hypothetical protein